MGYAICEEDFADEISRYIFRMRKLAYEENDASYYLKIACHLHPYIVNKIKEKSQEAEACIIGHADKNRGFVIFGAGRCGRKTFEYLKRTGLEERVLAFCDNDEAKAGTLYCGKPVWMPEEVKNREGIIVIIPFTGFYYEMKMQLLHMGISSDCILCTPSHLAFYKELDGREDLEQVFFEPDAKFVVCGNEMAENIFAGLLRRSHIFVDQVEDVGGALEKSETRPYYVCLDGQKKAKLREKGVPEDKLLYFVPELDEWQYFDSEVLPAHKAGEEEIFVDGGSYNLDSSSFFLDWCDNECKKIYAFECDGRGIELCEKHMEWNSILKEKTAVVPKGLWSGETILYFCEEENGTCSHISKDCSGDAVEIGVTSIDKVLDGEKATLIKMDIEGSELEALKGAEGTIKKYHPSLAICIYHKAEDVLAIPAYIKSLVPEYKLYIRNYHEEETETVVYAIYPEEGGR